MQTTRNRSRSLLWTVAALAMVGCAHGNRRAERPRLDFAASTTPPDTLLQCERKTLLPLRASTSALASIELSIRSPVLPARARATVDTAATVSLTGSGW